jgi:alpha-L-fucosidase
MKYSTGHSMSTSNWFSEARFGMFVHWGLYSICGGVWNNRKMRHSYAEWLQNSEQIDRKTYAALAKRFNPTSFDAETWIGEAKQAGMKYFVITAKHHDGFCLWPTKHSAFNVMDATPFKRDILAELTDACRKYGIKLGFYYSHWQDWDGSGGDVIGDLLKNPEYTRPSQKEFEHYWQHKCLAQVRELIETYDPDLLWFDSWGTESGQYITPRRQEELIDLIREYSPRCLVNSRIRHDAPSDRCDYLSMMDNTFPDNAFDKPWETSGTLNDTWGYHQLDYAWKSTDQLIRNLVNNASFGGNYQLNVGPTPEGLFQPAAIKRLREIGAWMDINGQSIYGTQAGPLAKQIWGTTTINTRDNADAQLFVHAWSICPGTALYLPNIKFKVIESYVLETGQKVSTEKGTDGLWIYLPEQLKNLSLPVIALTLSSV